jgi:TRAP transporter TAXI family solute receptor
MIQVRRGPPCASVFAGLVALTIAGAISCRAPDRTPARQVLRFTTGTPGARFHPLGQALARAYAAALPTLDMVVMDSAGSVANVDALQRGEADLGLSYADVAYMAYAGRLREGQPAFSDLRGITVLELAPVHLVVRAGSGIDDASQLRGRRIAVGPTGSGSALTAEIVLKAIGIETTAARVESLAYNEAAARLAAGAIDALFVTGSDPVDSVRVATNAGARILPLGGPAIDQLRHDYPFFRPTIVARGTYPGHADPIHTIGVDNLLVCRRGLDEAVVHDVTKQFFAQLPSIAILSGMDLEQAPATPIPLHDGAARYYRERELSR